MELVPADTRVFLFHSPNAAHDTSGAMDDVNQWLSKDRSQTLYANLRVSDITVTPDGSGGVYTINPKIFWKGSADERDRMIRENGDRLFITYSLTPPREKPGEKPGKQEKPGHRVALNPVPELVNAN